MAEWRITARAVLDTRHHEVGIAKDRYSVLQKRVAERTRDLLRQFREAPPGTCSGGSSRDR